MSFTEIGWGSVDWTHLLAGCYKHGNEPWGSTKF